MKRRLDRLSGRACLHTSFVDEHRLFCGNTARIWLTSHYMPKKGIHPVLRTVTYVLKNGASVELPTVQQRSVPYTLQAVSRYLALCILTLVRCCP